MANNQDIKISFLGAAGEVTGSCYLVEAPGVRFLVDCGMFQGGKYAAAKNRAAFAFAPDKIDFVVLTHAHIDHSGLVPKLCMDGFTGPVYATAATTQLLAIMLRDSAHIHQSEAERANRNHKNHIPVKPLYTMADADKSLLQVSAKPYDRIYHPHENIRICMRDAGHILGSAILEIWIKGRNGERKVVFSGDLGQPGRPILRNPALIGKADYLIVESTYGDRLHKALAPSLDEFVEIIDKTIVNGNGNIIIPAFAVGRSQEIIYYLYHLTRLGRVRNLRVFLDSPMAQSVTDLTIRHIELFDDEAKKLAAWQNLSGDEMTLKFTRSVAESMAINAITSGAIIISASGMCTAGRILHHLRHGLPRRENTILIAGYQAQGTLGRRLVDGAGLVKIFGQDIKVRAQICTIGGFSAHADQKAILGWLDAFDEAPRHIFITHGEPQASSALAQKINERPGWKTSIPAMGESAFID